MKKMKKMLSLLLVLSMVLSMSFASAFADDGNGHTHNEGEWTCTQELQLTCETAEHTHGEGCYESGVLTCLLEEHTHGGECYKEVWNCTPPDAAGQPGSDQNQGNTQEPGTDTPDEPEASVEVKAFLDAVAALEILSGAENPDADAFLVAQQKVIDLYDALGDEDKALLETKGDYANMVAGLKEAVTLEEPEPKGSIVASPENAMTDDGNGVYTVHGDCTITVTGTEPVPGRIVVESGTVEITGTGTIDAGNFDESGNPNENGIEGSVITVKGGANVTLSGVTIKGGTGTKNIDGGVTQGEETSGGGVLVENGSFIMTSGIISGNQASRGGGIYVALQGKLSITGGTITGNTATGVERLYKNGLPIQSPSGEEEYGSGNFGGGGIWINGEAKIYPTSVNIEITHNTSMTQKDLGGGGIYVNNDGSLHMTYAKITGNTAEGLGGGLATCIHGRIALVDVNGAAIYSNTGKGNVAGLVSAWSGADVDGSQAWSKQFNKNAPDNFAENAQDVLSAGKSSENSGTVISNDRFDGLMHNWKGYVTNDLNAPYTFTEISAENNGVVYGGYALGLTAQNTTKASTLPEGQKYMIDISNNTSATHGGGVGCNGALTLGVSDSTMTLKGVSGDLNVTATKKLDGDKPMDGQFTFELLDKNLKQLSTASNDAEGNVKLSYSNAIDNKTLGDPDNPGNKDFENNYTFYVHETNTDRTDIDCDKSVYKVDVTIKLVSRDERKIGNFMTVYTENYSVDSTTYTKGHFTTTTTEDGQEVKQWEADSNAEGTSTAPTFYNTTNPGKLKINKTVISSTPLQKDESFDFTVTLTNANGNPVTDKFAATNDTGETTEYTFDDEGKATVHISGFETVQDENGRWTAEKSVTIEGIPAGTQYTVVETADSSKDYNVSYGGNYSDRVEGNIPAGDVSEANITNTMKPGSLRIDKTVVSDTPLQANEQFDFIVALTVQDEVERMPERTFGDYSFKFNDETGAYEATVTISGFEATQDATDGRWKSDTKSVTIDGLPAGTTYTVKETDESRGRYTATYNGQNGVIQLGDISTVDVLNTYTYTPYVPPVTPTPEDPTTPPTEIDDPDTPLAPGPDEPVVDIDDPDTPLAPAAPDEPVTEIDEEEPPLAGAPKTGDDFQLWTWIALVMASGAGLAWLALTDRKRKNAVK